MVRKLSISLVSELFVSRYGKKHSMFDLEKLQHYVTEFSSGINSANF